MPASARSSRPRKRLLERRLAEIPTSEWHDLSVDMSPREYVLDYLAHGFPVQLFEVHSDEKGNLVATLAFDADGQPIVSREAAAKRDAMIEHVAGLPPLATALDQIIQHFGEEKVAEVTGRKRRVVRKKGLDGVHRFAIDKRSASANLAEAHAFMDDEKPILIFSEAGGTGRSYHADKGAKNQRRRIHYLIEPGWRVEPAIQGLGRSHRTNQRARRCSGPASPTSRARSASSRRSLVASMRWGRSRVASARPAGRGCSSRRTISKATMRARRSISSTEASPRGRRQRSGSRSSKP